MLLTISNKKKEWLPFSISYYSIHLHTTHPRKCWRPQGSYSVWWCGIRHRCRFHRECPASGGRCRVLYHTSCVSPKRSSPEWLCLSDNGYTYIGEGRKDLSAALSKSYVIWWCDCVCYIFKWGSRKLFSKLFWYWFQHWWSYFYLNIYPYLPHIRKRFL